MKNPLSAITNFLNQDQDSSKEKILDIKDDPKAGLKMIFAKTSPLGKLIEAKRADKPWTDEFERARGENFWEKAYEEDKLNWISSFKEEDLKEIDISEVHTTLNNLDVHPWRSLDVIAECKEARKKPTREDLG